MNKIKSIIITLFLLSGTVPGFAAITAGSVVLTAMDPPTTLSNGRSYFLAGKDYRFRIQAASPDNSANTDWGNISLNIYDGATSRASFTYNVGTTATTETNLVITNITNNTTVYSNIDYTITVRFTWNNTDFVQASNNVTVIVNDNAGAAPLSLSRTNIMTYGMSTHIDVYDFKMNGDAADKRINPDHNAFTVTGNEIVYYIPVGDGSSGAADSVRTIATLGANEITGSTTLLYDGGVSAFTDADETAGAPDNLTYSVTAGAFIVLGNHNLRVRTTMATGTATVDSPALTQIVFNVNTVRITLFQFFNGGGIDAPLYYRSVNVPGTEVRITAAYDNATGGATMQGNTTVTIRRVGTAETFTVQINSGATTGTALVPNPLGLTNYTTTLVTYEILSITGSAYDNEQDTVGEINQPANPGIYWDYNDPPGINGSTANSDGDGPGVGLTPFTGWVGYSTTATSMTLTWTALALNVMPAAGPYDYDFYTYRIYYRENGSATWTIIDRSVAGYNGAPFNLGAIATNSASIENLKPFTRYDYYITAVDIFGNEVDTATGTSDAINGAGTDFDTLTTNPYEVKISLTDGITKYADSSFSGEAVPVPANRPLRNSAERIDIYWASISGSPDSVNIILSTYPGPNAGNMVIIPGGNLFGTSGTDYDRIPCSKSAPNTWTGFIPSGNRYMTVGANLKFIIESEKAGVKSYVDHDSDFDPAEQVPPGDPNDIPWTFTVIAPTTFTPWPTRVLNNVITDTNPVAYPSYYLTDDAFVTIKSYDIKGRVVAVLLEDAFRKKGQNIKEQGWRGTNKSNRKLGVGLYYVHIKAKRASDGKVIIDKFSKVVMAR